MGLKTKLGMAVATSAAGAAMITGGSFALFSANATNSGNTFTAGTLTLSDFTGKDVASTMAHFNNLAPGDSDTQNITIKNTGNLDAWVKVDTAATQTSETGGLFQGQHPLTLSFGSDGKNTPVEIPAGGQATFPVTYNFCTEADDSYQGATGSVNIVFDGVQARNNTDGNAPITMPTRTPFITPQDFNVTAGWAWPSGGINYTGYSLGFGLAKSPKADGVTNISVSVYDGTKLLQTNYAGPDTLNLTATSLSTPFESDTNTTRYADTYWNYGGWNGTPGEKPTKAIITVTDAAGHTYTAVENAY